MALKLFDFPTYYHKNTFNSPMKSFIKHLLPNLQFFPFSDLQVKCASRPSERLGAVEEIGPLDFSSACGHHIVTRVPLEDC